MPQNIEEENHISALKAKIGKTEFVILMAALMATNAFAIDIMLPAMADMTQSLGVMGENTQHYIISAYLLGFGVSQLFFGPISDRFGRRIPIILGLIFYSLTSIACTFAPSFAMLLLLRAIQGIAAAATRVLTVSIVRDLYGGRQMAEVMSIIMMVFMIIPVIAPATGQLILMFGPWHLIFFFMALAGFLILLWVLWRLPETLHEKRPLTFASIGSSLYTIITNRVSLCYTLAFSVILGGLFASLNTAEQIYDGIYKLDKWFPAAFAIVATFQALSSFLNSRLVGKIGMRKISHTLLFFYIGASFVWLLWQSNSDTPIPFPIFMILFIVIMFSFGGMGANFNALAMESLGKIAGTASAVFGFMQTTIGAGLGFLISQQFHHTTTPIAIGFSALGLLALIFVLIAEKGRLFKPHYETVSTKIVSETKE